MRKYNQLIERDGKLILTGVSENVLHQLERTVFIEETGREKIYVPSIIFGDQLRKAWKEAEKWIQHKNS